MTLMYYVGITLSMKITRAQQLHIFVQLVCNSATFLQRKLCNAEFSKFVAQKVCNFCATFVQRMCVHAIRPCVHVQTSATFVQRICVHLIRPCVHVIRP